MTDLSTIERIAQAMHDGKYDGMANENHPWDRELCHRDWGELEGAKDGASCYGYWIHLARLAAAATSASLRERVRAASLGPRSAP